ncbi:MULTISPECIES: AraC family transcriptional regulator [unclassified Rhizobium]|uniref:AraC family transcriptional regulator n=1 Tax=unclassified Rhizobium TaxID=2613769 RepID=UPI0021F7C438|nr:MULTISPECIES: AraC family transcriptional regulator [unclassified Rhizobium]MCV9946943.1 AraC family transcriptional regulator [Rhizobium sp. BT-175]MCW0020913.1 AraC family transcriptional regulator [Rhizobium sp. BT-226]
MDPLSEFLSLLKPTSTISSGFEATGDWSIQFGDQQRQIKCYVILSGGCWLAVDGIGEVVRLEAGDCFVLPRGLPFRLASDLDLPSVTASTIFPPARAGGMVTVNGGGSFSLVGARFAVGGNHADMLLEMLPPIVHLRQEAEREALRWAIERMMQEVRSHLPGGYLMAQYLAHMMLLQALRIHLAKDHQGTGWFYALADKHLSSAIRAIHAEPAKNWTLAELGETAGMSRSVFAERFKAAVGETPIEYLSRWRMLLACDRLEKGDDPISIVAPALGYQSESAFSKAFKRVVGCSPRQYRGQGNLSSETRPAD